MKKYFAQQEYLLKLEYDYEKQEYEELCRNVGVIRRIRQGKCWYPIFAGRTYYNALNQLVLEVVNNDQAIAEGAQKDIEHEFEPGRPVAFFRTPSKSEGGGDMPIFFPYQCTISRVDDQRMQVTIPNIQAAETLRDYAMQGLLGVQLSFDATSHRVMREAINKIRSTEDKKLINLRNVLIGDGHPSFRTPQPVNFPWLNTSQNSAIQKVLRAREVAIVHGHWQDYDTRRGNQRDTQARDTGSRLRTEQRCRRLDLRTAPCTRHFGAPCRQSYARVGQSVGSDIRTTLRGSSRLHRTMEYP